MDDSQRSPGNSRLPMGIWALGFVSMLMDISSEMIHALLPVYLTVGLGASTLAVGVIEGIAEATGSITRVFSGALSDRLGRRKPLAVAGYGLAALTKFVFPLAPSVGWLVGARFVDRIGKGIRGAPRDALVADIAPAHLRGAAFGLRQSLDTVGAFLGPLAAIGLMGLFANDFRSVFWVAVLPAMLCVAVLLVAVDEPARREDARTVRNPLARAEIARLGSRYALVVAIATLFTLARFSEAFLVLRAQQQGLALMWVPLVLVAMNLAYAASAWPVGALSDRVGRVGLLLLGLGVLIVADLALADARHPLVLGAGVLLFGLHLGITQGLLAALVTDCVPASLRGTAFGLYHFVTGLALLAASVIAGALWYRFGAPATFQAGASIALLTLVVVMLSRARLAATTSTAT